MRRLAPLAGVAALGAAAALGWRELARADERAVLADPEGEVLATPIEGEAVSVVAADGTALHAELFGPPDAPTVVLVHGWVCSLEMWLYQVRALSPDHRVVAYDLRGHAASEPAASGDYSMDVLAADLDAVLGACVPEGRRAVVVGHSMGAMSIVAWAGAHGGDVERRLAGAVLLNTGVERLIAEARVVITAAALARLKHWLGTRLLHLSLPAPSRPSPLGRWLVRHLALSRRATPAQVAFCERMFLRCRPDVRAAFGATLAGLDLVSALADLVVPTVVVTGELDRLTPPVHGRAMVEVLPDAELVELEATGHTSPLEAHAEVTDLIRAVVRRRVAGRDAG